MQKLTSGSRLSFHFIDIYSQVFINGIYCMLVTAHLLNLLTPELVEGTASFLASCKTYEGAFSSASLPYYLQGSLLPEPRPPLGEAHGGYTFYALASWVILQLFINAESCSKKQTKYRSQNAPSMVVADARCRNRNWRISRPD